MVLICWCTTRKKEFCYTYGLHRKIIRHRSLLLDQNIMKTILKSPKTLWAILYPLGTVNPTFLKKGLIGIQ